MPARPEAHFQPYTVRSSDKLGFEITPNLNDDSFLCPTHSSEFESGHWSETPKSSSALVGGKVVAEDVIIRSQDLYQPTDRHRINSSNLTRIMRAGWALGLAITLNAHHLT